MASVRVFQARTQDAALALTPPEERGRRLGRTEPAEPPHLSWREPLLPGWHLIPALAQIGLDGDGLPGLIKQRG